MAAQALRTATAAARTAGASLHPSPSSSSRLATLARTAAATRSGALVTFRAFSTTPLRSLTYTAALPSDSFSRPAPPSLPPHLQREFEELVKRAQTPAASDVKLEEGEEVLHPDLRRKPKPQFEGDRNPETGEVGGPKNEPLTHGDWSYSGRATDF
ncbi:hypothetical protein NBRC10512_002187 [Rhodotorula toruloides]|uniref:Succinate dehydrogenase assembly factor 4, mitochondrial n=2 Tax=Rhodotorula toruloides TaxID=5286 RepID=A0A061AHU3_RHOTO|nr:DUF1674 domain protein [Rhodotorula toruloides NP11]EMS23553.1 DUF1674 domain protein [Rhodotorula toruloides NP11]CDR37122.1 RHTO0S02e11012g1_1 [Rhodotorula toruloides]